MGADAHHTRFVRPEMAPRADYGGLYDCESGVEFALKWEHSTKEPCDTAR